MSKILSIELFAGAAGLGLGLKQAGVNTIAFAEKEINCQNTIRMNSLNEKSPLFDWPEQEFEDVINTDFSNFCGTVDLVSGGPPCQPFSLGGKHMANADVRDMFPEAVRVLREVRPKAFIFENVRGITRKNFQPYFEYLKLQMKHPQLAAKHEETWMEHYNRIQKHHVSRNDSSDDYRVLTFLLNAADYGVPQKRYRVFFVGFRADLGVEWSCPKPTHSRDALINQIVSGEYLERNKILKSDLALSKSVMKAVEVAQGDILTRNQVQPWKTVREAISSLPQPSDCEDNYLRHTLRLGARSYVGHTGSPLDEPSKTLKAGVHAVPGGENLLRDVNGNVRYFSIRECARLQTYPDNFVFSGSWSSAMRQLGNAVPVNLGKVLGKSIVDVL